MISVLFAAMISLAVCLIGTPLAIRIFRSLGYGQLIRDDGPTTHHTKRGTPTMGGTVIILATLIGYLSGHLVTLRGFTASAVLVLGLMSGLGNRRRTRKPLAQRVRDVPQFARGGRCG